MRWIAFLPLLAAAPAFGAEVKDSGYYTAIADAGGHLCQLQAEALQPGGQPRLVFTIRQEGGGMTVTYLSQHRAVAETDFVAVKLDFTEVFGFAAAQKHEFFNVAGVSYQSHDLPEQQDFYRLLHQATSGAKHFVVVSADYTDFLPTLGLEEALGRFEGCLQASGRGL